MVEVVQDLLDHVTYAGGVGRRRVDAVRGIGSGTPQPGDSDCAVIAEDPSQPKGPRIVRMKDLMFHEVLDKPFDEKEYRLQLEEFAYRGERIINQVDQKLGEVQQMVVHDVLARSRQLPHFLRETNDELRRGHKLICQELEEVWHMRFEPFFYPSEDEDPVNSAWPGGWLDLDDMFLTARLLTRYVAELVALIGAAVSQLPDEALDREQLISGQPDPGMQVLVQAFSVRVPWIGASLLEDFDTDYGSSGLGEVERSRSSISLGTTYSVGTTTRDSSKRSSMHSILSEGDVDELDEADHDPTTQTGGNTQTAGDGSAQPSPLNDAITALNTVLTVHLNHLVSDLHRTMYQTFVRMCTAYVRWKRAFPVKDKSKAKSPTSPTSPKSMTSTRVSISAQRRSLSGRRLSRSVTNFDDSTEMTKPTRLSSASSPGVIGNPPKVEADSRPQSGEKAKVRLPEATEIDTMD